MLYNRRAQLRFLHDHGPSDEMRSEVLFERMSQIHVLLLKYPLLDLERLADVPRSKVRHAPFLNR